MEQPKVYVLSSNEQKVCKLSNPCMDKNNTETMASKI